MYVACMSPSQWLRHNSWHSKPSKPSHPSHPSHPSYPSYPSLRSRGLRLFSFLHIRSSGRIDRARAACGLPLLGLAPWHGHHLSISRRAIFSAVRECRGGSSHPEIAENLSGDAPDTLHSQSSILARATQTHDDVCKCDSNFSLVFSLLLHCDDSLVDDFCGIDTSCSSRVGSTGHLEWLWHLFRFICNDYAVQFDVSEDFVGWR